MSNVTGKFDMSFMNKPISDFNIVLTPVEQDFDSGNYSPNKLEVYNQRWNNYLSNLSKDSNKINVKKAKKYFDSLFELDWNNQQTANLLQTVTNNAKNSFLQLRNNFQNNWDDILIKSLLDINTMNGLQYDPSTGSWTSSVAKSAQQPEERSMYWWLKLAQKVNPEFKSIEDVRNWQEKNGLIVDGKFGKNSLTKWNELQNAIKPNTQTSNEKSWAPGTHVLWDTDISMLPINDYYTNNNIQELKQDVNKLNPTQATINRYLNNNTLQWKNGFIHDFLDKNLVIPISKFFTKVLEIPTNYDAFKNGGNINKFQQGGNMNNQEELQKAFMAFLIEDAQAQGVQIQSEQDLQAYAEQLGEDGLKAKYLEFMQKMQGGQIARLGAKLNYIKKLKGACPEGLELVYFKKGGKVCKACQGIKAQKGTDLTKKEKNTVAEFKAMRRNKKMDQASKDSIAVNKHNDLEIQATKPGKYKKGVWTPDRTKAPYKKK